MKLFGKNKETLRIKKAAAARAVFVDTETTDMEIKLLTEDGEKLMLILPMSQAAALINDLHLAHTAANPPLFTGRHQSEWFGMQ